MSHSRREVLTLAAAVFLPHHQSSLVRAQQPAADPASRRPRRQRIQLQTHVLGEIRRFYRDTLQFPEISTGRHEVARRWLRARVDMAPAFASISGR